MKMIASKLIRSGVLAAALVAVQTPLAAAESGYEVTASRTYSSSMKLQQPIDVNMEVSGVKLDSVFFDKDKLQAFIIIINRTPTPVYPKVGISLFDNRGKLIATGIDVTGFNFSGDKVGAGKQKNIELSFSKFINDFNNASSFQMVFALGKDKAPPPGSKPATSDPY